MSTLTIIDGLLRHDGAALVLSPRPGTDKPCCCTGCESLIIRYDWSTSSSRDLDTGTTFLGTKVGWSCGGGGPYIIWSGDNTSQSAQEYAIINFKQALDDGYWNTSTTVQLAAGWYSPAGGSGPIKIIVECYNETVPDTRKEKTASPGSQNNCASTSVGSVTIYEDGSFTLE